MEKAGAGLQKEKWKDELKKKSNFNLLLTNNLVDTNIQGKMTRSDLKHQD